MKKTLLIVDDEPAIRLILKQYLSAEFEIILKSNGREALQWLEEGHHADAIVADYHMPHLVLLFVQAFIPHPYLIDDNVYPSSHGQLGRGIY
jgi:CheY-like chemotaxis protein